MKTAINYFGKSALKISAFAFAYALVMIFILYPMEEFSNNFLMVAFLIVLMQVTGHIKLYRQDISISLSFGCSRKNIFLGTIFGDLVMVAVNCCFVVLIALIGRTALEDILRGLIVVVAISLIGDSIGNFLGMVYAKAGSKKILGTVIIVGTVYMVAMLASVIVIVAKRKFTEVISFDGYMYLALAICICIYIIQCLMRRKFIMRFVY